MSRISLGSFVSGDGATSGLGFASGLDSEALIESILSARQASITDVEDTITLNTSKTTEVTNNLRILMDRFKTSLDLLRAPPGIQNESNDLFKYTTASLLSSTSIAASNYLSVTSEAGATLNSYEIEDIVLAKAHQLRKDGFTSQNSSVVGNESITDNYQVNLGTVSGNVLNAATPVTFSNDVKGSKASIDIVFGTQNEFDATDEIEFDTTKITFGGGGDNDIDISGASTVAEKVALIASRMNDVTTGAEAGYIYTSNGNTLTVTREIFGDNEEAVTNLDIRADFSATSTTQTVQIGTDGASNTPADAVLNVEGTDGSHESIATSAYLDIVFGNQNQFDATDTLRVGGTTITFGGTGGDDIDISSATTLDDKIDAIVTHLNSLAVAPENTYTYSRAASGVLRATQDTTGTIASTGNDLTVSANFSTGSTDTTQTVAIGKNYENNGSTSGSVFATNGSTSGSVGENGVDGHAAAAKATVNIDFLNNNIDAGDTLTIGANPQGIITFGTTVAVGADLPETLVNIADYLNGLTTGDEAGYTYTTDGVDSLIVTRDVYGDDATIGNALAIAADFSAGADTANTVTIGSGVAANVPTASTVVAAGTDGVNNTSISDAKTTHTSTLSGAITIGAVSFIAGTSDANSFTPNRLEFTATVGGVTYTSKHVELDNGDVNATTGGGDNNLGNRIASGTVITFVKDTDGDSTQGTEDVTFNLVVGDEININNSGEADTYATDINTWLNTTNTITIGQNPTVPPLRAGTFTLGGTEITLAEGDTLQVIKSKINAVSNASGVVADIVQISDTNFSLVIKSQDTGLTNKILEFGDGDAGDSPLGTLQLGADNVTFTETQTASDATFTLDGQSISRSTNNINDVIDKITFSLLSDTPTDTPPSLTVNINSDNSVIKTGIQDFLNAYNELRFYISEQTERDEDNNLVEDALLGDDSLLRDILSSANNQLNRTISGISTGGLNTLFQVGIDTFDFPGDDETPETKDILILDEAKFDAAIAANFEAVRDVFTFTFTANSPDLSVFSHSNNLSLTDFVLDIDTTRAEGNQVRVLDATTNDFLFNADIDLEANTITGQDGTSIADLVLVYTGDGSDIITVGATSGIADSTYNFLDSYLESDGLLDKFIDSLTNENIRLQDRVDQEIERLESERAILFDEFTLLEAIITSANQTIAFLDSQVQANSAAS